MLPPGSFLCSETDEVTLIAYVKSGGTARHHAWRCLFERKGWARWCISHVMRNSGNEVDGKELAHNAVFAFEKALTGDNYTEERTPFAYFTGIAKLLWLKELRKRRAKKRIEFDELNDRQKAALSDEEAATGKLNAKELEKLIGEIGDSINVHCREIFAKLIQGYSHAEMLEFVELKSVQSLKNTLRKCRAGLDKLLENNPALQEELNRYVRKSTRKVR